MKYESNKNRDSGQTPLTRREFLAATSATAATVGLVALGKPASAAVPKKGGKCVFGLMGAATSDSLDPALFDAAYIQIMAFGGLRNCLTEIGQDGQLIGELAKEWVGADGAKRWTFMLRKGVEFHNGRDLTADDVIASINHHRGEASKSAIKNFMDQIEDIRSDGRHTVVVKLKSGNADFPFLLSDSHAGICPANGNGTIDWESGIGTGGYALKSFQPGVRATLKRYPNYWKEGRAHFDEAEMIGISNSAARVNALMTGAVHVISDLEIKVLDRFEKLKDFQVIEATGTRHWTMPMFTDVAPFDDNNVRLALKYAIDREALLETLLRGHGILGNDHPIAPSNRYVAADLEQRSYDPDKAKFHLKQAGLSDLTIDLSAADIAFVGAIDAAVLFREHAARAGININAIREPDDGYWSNVWMKKPFVVSYWSGRPTEDWMFTSEYAETSKWNDSHFKHDRFNKLLIEARTVIDDNKRREMYREMQIIVRDEGGVIIPVFTNHIDAASASIGHDDQIAGNLNLDGRKAVERWWFV